ncbi:hypothetical protein PC9H_009108 [Pleurotus ostreatus]|uniref:Uncharacterized protein n=1 Tax=Pleurotus ostreatus TaxID=5322 RepID=A0A8H6ZSK2_PLEOS|nr:uncharacterized protein PC9H_009108 [Pleurotus ostreatus]KAF7426739.1 hypothetical protein PC9H_009108 [Pleurotus ostreatus]
MSHIYQCGRIKTEPGPEWEVLLAGLRGLRKEHKVDERDAAAATYRFGYTSSKGGAKTTEDVDMHVDVIVISSSEGKDHGRDDRPFYYRHRRWTTPSVYVRGGEIRPLGEYSKGVLHYVYERQLRGNKPGLGSVQHHLREEEEESSKSSSAEFEISDAHTSGTNFDTISVMSKTYNLETTSDGEKIKPHCSVCLEIFRNTWDKFYEWEREYCEAKLAALMSERRKGASTTATSTATAKTAHPTSPPGPIWVIPCPKTIVDLSGVLADFDAGPQYESCTPHMYIRVRAERPKVAEAWLGSRASNAELAIVEMMPSGLEDPVEILASNHGKRKASPTSPPPGLWRRVSYEHQRSSASLMSASPVIIMLDKLVVKHSSAEATSAVATVLGLTSEVEDSKSYLAACAKEVNAKSPWVEFDWQEEAIQKDQYACLGLSDDGCYGGKIILGGKLDDFTNSIKLDRAELGSSSRFLRHFGSRHFLRIKIPRKCTLGLTMLKRWRPGLSLLG